MQRSLRHSWATTRPAPHRSRRRGSLYITALGTSTAITVIGLSALMATRIERRAARDTGDLVQAQLHARSAIEMAMFTIYNDSSWRTSKPNGTWAAGQPIGSGFFDLTGVDPYDGSLVGSTTDPVVLTGAGIQGEARHFLEVRVVAQLPPLNCLRSSFHTGSTLTFNAATVQSDEIISTNQSAVAVLSTVNANVEATGTISGSVYAGTTTPGTAPRDMPATTVFDYYIANGTPIDIALFTHNTHYDFEHLALSPDNNPFGPPNPEGIYVINCFGGELRLRNCRVIGTLVVLDPAPTSRVELSVSWQPAFPNFPSLLVRGDMAINITNAALTETVTNLNPIGVPYLGVVDIDQLDLYPSKIEGLIYISGAATLSNFVTIEGLLITGGTTTVTGALNISYQDAVLRNPPPGFAGAPQMVIAPGTWRRVVY